MRSVAAVAAFAGVAMAGYMSKADSTTYTTMYYTVTDCPPTVTDCPGDYMETTSSVVPMTTSTVYTTKVHTVHSCPDTVPDCPYDATTVVTETHAVSTTVCPVTDEPTYTPPPTHYYNTTSTYCPPEETSVYVPENPHTPEGPHTTHEPEAECPKTSVKTISTSYTTVIPTVIYETVEVPCPTAAPTTSMPHGGNHTATYSQPPPTYTAGASTMGASVVLAGVAALAAFLA